MEKKINDKVITWVQKFKSDIKSKIDESVSGDDLIQFVYDYETLTLEKFDFQKRKRVRNTIPLYQRCTAKRANGCQCTRRKKDGQEFCGTHEKGTPHGVVTNDTEEEDKNTQVEVTAHDINGIIYYIDNNSNVYSTEDVLSNTVNPKVIAKYEKDAAGNITIPSIFTN